MVTLVVALDGHVKVKMTSEEFYLELNPNVVSFEPASRINNVFFDDTNCQVIVMVSKDLNYFKIYKILNYRRFLRFVLEGRPELLLKAS